jgi:hypothetical protein
MLLRASGERLGETPDLRAVNEGAKAASGVRCGAELLAFTDAVLSRDAVAIAAARAELRAALGPEAVVDAAGVVANFERMNRIADAIGIPLDLPAGAASLDVQQELGLRRFASASHTPEPTPLQRALRPIAKPLLRIGARLLGGRG